MNDQHIYLFLARKPDSRAQDIADAMDVDLPVASASLRSLVDVGDVVRQSGKGPNGLPAQLYNLSDAYKRTKDGLAVLATVAGFKDAAPSAMPAPAAPVAVETPVFAQETTMPVSETIKTTKVNLAIAAVQKGSLSDDEMRIVMGIVRPANPSAFLVSAIKTGRIHKGEKGWTKGVAPGAATPYNRPYAKKKDGPKAQFGPTAKPEDPAPAAPVAKQPDVFVNVPEFDPVAEPAAETLYPDVETEVVAETELSEADRRTYRYENDDVFKRAPVDEPSPFDEQKPTVFRCGLWSDGVLELQRNGRAIAMLTRGEHEHMADFMRRMLGQVEQVAA